MTKTEGKTRQLIVYLSRSSIIMRCFLFLIPLQTSSPSIMPPSGRVHPPACVIWTFCRVSFACISNVVICMRCIQTNGSFKVSLCLHYVSLPILVLTSHSVHDLTHLDEIDWCLRDQWCVVQGDKGLVYFYDRNAPRGGGGLWGSEGVYCTFISETNVLYPP